MNNNAVFIGTHYGVTFPNAVQSYKIVESENFQTTTRNLELRSEYLTLRYNVLSQYDYHINPHLRNSTLLSEWVGQIYNIADKFTYLVERIEKG